jgi:hypothetical protein
MRAAATDVGEVEDRTGTHGSKSSHAG